MLLSRIFIYSFVYIYADNFLLRQAGKEFHVDQRSGHSFECAELRVDAQREEHQEEQNGPHLGARELVDGLGENDERQTGARSSLILN